MSSSERGRDIKDGVKTARDRARFEIAYSRDNSINKFRKDTVRNPVLPQQLPSKTTPIVFHNRGSDLKDSVKAGREKAQFIKAHSDFMRHTVPINTKIRSGLF
jgi:hypothetical protein